MSAYLKPFMYAFGFTAIGGTLFYALTPSTDRFQEKLSEKQGVLNRERSESQQNTQALMAKLRSEAGLQPAKEK